ncbi:uncharacterized protein LOC142231274 [Haematobia irritans]|uniref:uncharacterized protein LOC142231274 n=1 Tax=Haematobia irritans TaxID=7368 RepID=UPI003F4FB94E
MPFSRIGNTCSEQRALKGDLQLFFHDIVILADDIATLQSMIKKLEEYCDMWSLEVNREKSEVVIFRNGGPIRSEEKWTYKGTQLNIVNEFKYLGVLLTSRMIFKNHVNNRANQSKIAINTTWKDFLSKKDIALSAKWNIYNAVCRSILSYAAQVWGFGFADEVNSVQRFFLKKILRLPSHTPNYALALETNVEETSLYTLKLHIQYIGKVMLSYNANRLPKQLTRILIERNSFWVKELKAHANKINLTWPQIILSQEQWNCFSNELLYRTKIHNLSTHIQRKQASERRIYKYLDHMRSQYYIMDSTPIEMVSSIFRARAGVLNLNSNIFGANEERRQWSLCNLHEEETIEHFIGQCPVFRENRLAIFKKNDLSLNEVIEVLDGRDINHWKNLVKYISYCLRYRNFLINEFN